MGQEEFMPVTVERVKFKHEKFRGASEQVQGDK